MKGMVGGREEASFLEGHCQEEEDQQQKQRKEED